MFVEAGYSRCQKCGCMIPQCQSICREDKNKLKEERTNAT